MDRGPEEVFKDLTPDSIDFSGVEHLKRLAKKKQKELNCKLSEALEMVAHAHGFKSWNNVVRFASLRHPPVFEGYWRKPMLIEIRPGKNAYSLKNGYLSDISIIERINVAQVTRLFLNQDREYLVKYGSEWITTKQPISDDEANPRFLVDEEAKFAQLVNKPFRTITFHFGSGDNWESETYIFGDEGDYHRVKRALDDFTSGASKS